LSSLKRDAYNLLAGYFVGYKACAAGAKDTEAATLLEKNMKHGQPATADETVQAAVSALQSILAEDVKAKDIQVGVVSAANPTFRVLTTDEVDQALTAINERD
jgi:20S proteasome subunit alpha 1